MDQLWRDVQLRFQANTGKQLNFKPPKTLNDCIEAIENRHLLVTPNASTKKPGVDKAKEYGMDILHCLKLLGGVASQALGMVFSPSSLCFNALSLLLDIPANLHKFHNAVDGLFEKIGPALSMFKIYETVEQFDSIESTLKQAIHELMISFVDICSLYIKMRDSNRWEKSKTGLKLIFLDKDSGIQEEIDRFENLTKAHHNIQGTQTLKVVLQTNSNVANFLEKSSETYDILKDSEDKRKSDEVRRKHLRNIKAKLGLEDDSVVKASKAMSDEFYRNAVPETASWCRVSDEHMDFHKWVDRNDADANSLFLLTGESKTGKSFMMSCVLHQLRAIYESPISSLRDTSARQSPRTLIASYFFPSNTKETDMDRPTIETALKCIAVQFADADPAYAQRTSTELDGKADAGTFVKGLSPRELWDFLGLGAPKGTTAHYLIIDGLPDGQQEKCLGLLGGLASLPSSVRLILSTEQDMRKKIRNISSRAYNLEVEKYSERDICSYIDRELKNEGILQDQDVDSARLRMMIEKDLSTGVRGSYFRVKTALQKIKMAIAASKGEDAIQGILDEAKEKDEQGISQAMIDALKDRLTAREIYELNEILVWVIFGFSYFNIEHLNAGLFLCFKERSYQSLESKLAGKYANIFDTGSSGSSDIQVTDDMRQLLTKERTESRLQKKEDLTKFSVEIKIEKAEFKEVQTFLWSVMQKLTQEQFAFEKREEQAIAKGNIQVNEFDSHFTIVQRTFALLAAKPDKRSQALAPYLLDYLPRHLGVLRQATGLDLLTDAQNREIGDGLFSLFESGEVIARHWVSCDELTWYRNRDELDNFLTWLKDPLVVGHIRRVGKRNRDWLDQLTQSAGDLDPYGALLKEVMKVVAQHWLENNEWAVQQPFQWLQGFIAMIKKSDDAELAVDPLDAETVANWCKKELGVERKNQLWEERLAETFHAEGQYAKAIEMYNAALLERSSSTKLLKGLAESLAADNRYSEAFQKMNEAILESEHCSDMAALCNDYMRVAEWHSKLKDPKQAITWIRKALKLDPEFQEGPYKLLQSLFDDKDVKGATQLLCELAEDALDSSKANKFGQMIEYIAHDASEQVLTSDASGQVFANFFAIVFLEENDDHALCERTLREMDRAIDRARKDNRLSDLGTLLLYKGVAIYYYPVVQAEFKSLIESAVDSWSQCVEIDDGSFSSQYASQLLSAHHFEQARKSRDGEKHLEELKSIVKAERFYGLSESRAYLAGYFAFVEQPANARSTTEAVIEVAFEMLSDASVENDCWGFYDLAIILMHCGDTLNALSAFSLLLPGPGTTNVIAWLLDFDMDPEKNLGQDLAAAVLAGSRPVLLKEQMKRIEKQLADILDSTEQEKPNKGYEKIRARLNEFPRAKETGDWDFICDGGCGRSWNFDTALNHCKFCYGTGFCDTCLQILKNGTLHKHWVNVAALKCNKNHEWLRLEKWDKNRYLEPLRGNVLVGGKLEGGQRVGGELVPISTWLSGLKQEWGYES